jgi:hypothetical protein
LKAPDDDGNQLIEAFCQIERLEGDRMPKKIFTQELEGQGIGEDPGKDGKRKERDLQVLGVRRWRELVVKCKGKAVPLQA